MRFEILRVGGVGVQREGVLFDLSRRHGLAFVFQNRLNRMREFAVPELLEVSGHFCNGLTQEQYVAIAKIVFVVEIEILVRHVPATRDAGDIIEDGGLVMHALVDSAKVRECVAHAFPETYADRQVGVIDTNVHVLMRRQDKQCLAFCINQRVINQHSDSYATFRCTQEALGSERADIVGAPDEILNVDSACGIVRQPCATDERLFSFLKNVDTRLLRHEVCALNAIAAKPLIDGLRSRIGGGTKCNKGE